MGQKDITEKLLEDYNDVFADILNVLLFEGKQVVRPETLKETKVKSQYKADDSKIHEMERDVVKLWQEGKVSFALCGIENQTRVEKEMPLRILNYDGASYRSQLLKEGKKRYYPILTIILYFGKSHWEQPKTLKEVLDIPPILDNYINDYKIHVFEISWLTEEQVEMFQSDFRAVAEFFTQIRKKNEYKPTEIELKHVDEVLKLLAVFGEADKFAELISSGKSKEVKNMCQAVDRIEEQGIEKGIKQGIEQGIEKGIKQGIEQGIEKGILSLVEAMEELGQSKENILQMIMKKFSLTEEKAKTYQIGRAHV